MALNKFDQKSDGIADLYRSALYLAKGADKLGLEFLRKAREKLGRELVKSPDKLKNRQQKLLWAEKILDQYTKLRSSLS
ncbi:hypothetical protein COT65_01015 [Candidatus Shapirobacteria bacterium CG09_land_8_20_14_0_10_47_13]|uniref:Uncharacterized protein n=1 Tax=Candidatus Shapirobacteria bacterium CG09_land_8_20_14_0_10_47_13 TaxID=1974481 RepID=A0A2H0WN20_9BACT|nr:MAG: hypothetical protein COT65_01015 [Candidatus Shapirobacteria bacterium CG09_land_8_20_14_0_10_47_13]